MNWKYASAYGIETFVPIRGLGVEKNATPSICKLQAKARRQHVGDIRVCIDRIGLTGVSWDVLSNSSLSTLLAAFGCRQLGYPLEISAKEGSHSLTIDQQFGQKTKWRASAHRGSFAVRESSKSLATSSMMGAVTQLDPKSAENKVMRLGR
jgi:hypothetical protein